MSQHPALIALQKIENDLKTGNVADNEEVGTKLKEIQMHTCQLIMAETEWKCGNDLLKADKAHLISVIDAMATILFYPEWTPQEHEIDAENEND